MPIHYVHSGGRIVGTVVIPYERPYIPPTPRQMEKFWEKKRCQWRKKISKYRAKIAKCDANPSNLKLQKKKSKYIRKMNKRISKLERT